MTRYVKTSSELSNRADGKSQVRQCLGFCTADSGQGGPQISCTKTQTLPNLRLPISSAHDITIGDDTHVETDFSKLNYL